MIWFLTIYLIVGIGSIVGMFIQEGQVTPDLLFLAFLLLFIWPFVSFAILMDWMENNGHKPLIKWKNK